MHLLTWLIAANCILLKKVEALRLPFLSPMTKPLQRTICLYSVGTDSIPENAFTALDLAPFLRHLKSFACTKRGKQAILDLIPAMSSLGGRGRERRKRSLFDSISLSDRKRRFASTSRSSKIDASFHHALPVAQSKEDAVLEYRLVNEAMEIISQNDSTRKNLPPMFQLSNGDTESDEDEWVELCMNSQLDRSLYGEIDLETIIQAECLVKLLLDTHSWSTRKSVESSYSGLVGVVREISRCVEHLSKLYHTLEGAVEIVRPKSTLNGDKLFYMFQLARGKGRFPELDSLRDREEKLLLKIKGNKNADNDVNNHRQLATIRDEISVLEQQATHKMIATMIDVAPYVQRALHALARLDVIFARAAFACEWGGVIPEVGNEASIDVNDFIHPVLVLEKIRHVVPVDLFLSDQVLVISGPNSGGKTVAIKSFGMVSCFVKLGIPITVKQKPSEDCKVRVDFFDDIFIQIGDNQDIISGESTLMARLNAYSTLIQRVETTNATSVLALLDELGGGTDPFAGAALSTAILEKLVTNPFCKVVATTHSPQLKALSLDDERFRSASVMLESQEGDEKEQIMLACAGMKPTYKLHYGFATESYPLGAASRCNPSLPDDVIRRAAELMSKGSDGDDTVEALRRHMMALEHELSSAKKLTKEAKMMFDEVAAYKRDMIGKMQASESHLSRIEARLQNMYETLSDDKTKTTYDLIGDGLSTLRLLKKAVKSEEEMLIEKGLRRVSEMHSFYDNESVVIVAEGEWQWQNAVVRMNDSATDISNNQEMITVVPSLDFAFGFEETSQSLLVVNRKDLAVWDIPGWGLEDKYEYGSNNFSERNKSSSTVLELLKQVKNKTTNAQTVDKSTPSFTSARERKAAVKKALTKKGKKK